MTSDPGISTQNGETPSDELAELSPDAALARLGSRREGLSDAEAAERTVDESTLTGEAYPAEKTVTAGASGAMRADCAYTGTVVRTGRGVGVAVATGARTQLGRVAGGIHEHQPPTAFQRGLTSFA